MTQRLRDNQALRDEVIGMVWSKRPTLGADAISTALRILDAVDRALTATGQGAPDAQGWAAYVRWACDRPPSWPCRCGNTKAAHEHSLVASMPGKCGSAGCYCPRFEPEYETNVKVTATGPGSGAADLCVWPCANCRTMRTKAQGGNIFTICDTCWNIAAAANTIPRAAPQTDHRAPKRDSLQCRGDNADRAPCRRNATSGGMCPGHQANHRAAPGAASTSGPCLHCNGTGMEDARHSDQLCTFCEGDPWGHTAPSIPAAPVFKTLKTKPRTTVADLTAATVDPVAIGPCCEAATRVENASGEVRYWVCKVHAGVRWATPPSGSSPGVQVVSEGPPSRTLGEILRDPPRLTLEGSSGSPPGAVEAKCGAYSEHGFNGGLGCQMQTGHDGDHVSPPESPDGSRGTR